MGLRDMLKGKNLILNDKDIVNDMLKDSKFGLVGLSLALSECTNPKLRTILMEQFYRCAADHHELTDLAMKKDWYHADIASQDQLRTDQMDSKSISH